MDIASLGLEFFAQYPHGTKTMVVYNYSGKEINAKIVYYGPALSGKTTNLEWIYSKIPVEYSGKMVSLRTQADRTIFFDFLPLDLGMIDGFRTRFMLYTVPGQVHYNATRKMVLKGVDGLVFVADSEPGRMQDNIESLQNLRDNLVELGLDPDSLPLVLQWNKRDLPHCMSTAELESQLNPRGLPSFEACALTGEGVYETLHKVCRLIYTKLTGLQMGGGGDDEDVSLFGDPIAQCLQDVDVPEPEPERVALDPASAGPVPSGSRSAEDVLGAILGSRSVPPVDPANPPMEEEVAVPVGAAADEESAQERSAPSMASPSLAASPGPATRSPFTPSTPGPRSQAVRALSGRSKSLGPVSSGIKPYPPEEDDAVDDLVDEVLFRLDETDEAPPSQSQPTAPVSAPPTGPATAPVAGGGEGDMSRPVIEHEPNIFDHLQSRREVPEDPAPSGAIPMGGIDLDDVLGESKPGQPEEEPEFITDPLKLPGERAASGPSTESTLAGLGSGSFGAPARNAKILEVPVTIDANALEEGKTIRVVLNLTVKR